MTSRDETFRFTYEDNRATGRFLVLLQAAMFSVCKSLKATFKTVESSEVIRKLSRLQTKVRKQREEVLRGGEVLHFLPVSSSRLCFNIVGHRGTTATHTHMV